MNNITSRLYENEHDIQIILDLMYRVRPEKHRNDYPVKVDIEENFASDTVCANTRLWFEGDRPVAWAYVDLFNNLRCEVEPALEEPLGAEIVAWCEACVRKILPAGGSATLDASCREDHRERVAFLLRNGFRQTQDTTLCLVRALLEPLPDPVLPPGYIIRPITGRQEVDAVASSHRAAFGTEHMTTESRLAIMDTSEYDMSLDLVVVSPDGSIAGNCICSVNETQKRGFTDPISVHPDFQGMGLARALLLAGMKLLRERGMESARLGTSGTNHLMQRTAEAVGFTIEYKTIWFSKEVQ